MKKLLTLLAVLLLVLSLAACSPAQQKQEDAKEPAGNTNSAQTDSKDSAAQGDEIVFGTVGPMTGNLAEYGTNVRNGAALAIEEINANGGILGKQIKHITYDSEGDVEKAGSLFTKLVEVDKMTALVGPVITAECNVISELAQEMKVPMFTPSGTGIEFTKGKDYVYRMCFTDAYQGVLIGKYVSEVLKYKKAAVLYNNGSDYSIGLANAFKAKAEELGVEIVNFEAYSESDSDFSAVLTKIKENNPDAIFIPDYYSVVANIFGQIRTVGIQADVFGGDGWDGAQVEFADAVEGGLFVSHYSIKNPEKLSADFTKAYKEKFGSYPNSFGALSYDVVYTYKAAIEQANSTDAQAIVDALKTLKVDTVCSPSVQFDENGDPKNKSAQIQIFKNGDVEYVTQISGE